KADCCTVSSACPGVSSRPGNSSCKDCVFARCRLRRSSKNTLDAIRSNQERRFVPFWNKSNRLIALTNVSCVRSSVSCTFPVNECRSRYTAFQFSFTISVNAAHARSERFGFFDKSHLPADTNSTPAETYCEAGTTSIARPYEIQHERPANG